MDYFKTIDAGITISDLEGNILYMNDQSSKTFGSMVGQNMMGCHSSSSQQIIDRLIANKETNAYTIEKGGVKKLIYQTPWYNQGEIAGLVELSLVIPFDMPHHVRGPKKEEQ